MAQESVTVDALPSNKPLSLDELRIEWQRRRAAGETPTPEEICRDCVELLDQFRKHVDEWEREDFDSQATAADAIRPKSPQRLAPWPNLPGYEYLGESFAGGMSVVYKARDLALDRIVAIKVLRSGQYATQAQIKRFLREGKALAKLEHRHVVRIHALQYHDGLPYIAMEWAGGGSLDKQRETLAADPKRIAAIMEKIARAVHYLHQNGVYHRDIKPGNILLDERGEPKLTDFGLVKLFQAEDGKTQTYGVIGTLPYLAPEQFDAGDSKSTEQTDIWSLGVTLYELLARRRPFDADSQTSLSTKVRTARPPPLDGARPGIDRSLDVIVNRCLEKDPRDRYPTAEALADDLAKWQAGEPILPESRLKRSWRKVKRNWRWAAVGVAFCLVLAAMIALAVKQINPIDGPQPDPDRELAAMKDEWRQGHTVTVIPAGGEPRWSRWRIGQDRGVAYLSKEPSFVLGARDIAALELADEVPLEEFRIEGRIRHDEGHDIAQAGFYLSLQHFDSPNASLDVFLEFSFVGVGEQVKILTERHPDRKRTGLIEVQSRFYLDPPHIPTTAYTTGVVVRDKVPSTEGEWRTLAIDVRRDALQFLLNGTPVAPPLDIATFERDTQLLVKRYQRTFEFKPRWQFNRGIGIFVINSSASFRSVTIGPIPK